MHITQYSKNVPFINWFINNLYPSHIGMFVRSNILFTDTDRRFYVETNCLIAFYSNMKKVIFSEY